MAVWKMKIHYLERLIVALSIIVGGIEVVGYQNWSAGQFFLTLALLIDFEDWKNPR